MNLFDLLNAIILEATYQQSASIYTRKIWFIKKYGIWYYLESGGDTEYL